MQRRQVLLGTAAACSGLTGCSALSSESSTLGFLLFNQTDSPYTVELTLYRSDVDASRSEARAYSASIHVEPAGEVRREVVAEARPYRVEYHLYEDHSRLTDEDHVHYYPTDEGDDIESFDITESGVLTRR